MLLNTMTQQPQTGAQAPLLLAPGSSAASSVATISTSPSSSSSSSSHNHQIDVKNEQPDDQGQISPVTVVTTPTITTTTDATTTTSSSSNATFPSESADLYKTIATSKTANRSSNNQHYFHHSNNNYQQPNRFKNHHHQQQHNSHHNHHQRGHNNNHHHQQNHHNHNQQQQRQPCDENNISVNSTSQLPQSNLDVNSTTATTSNNGQHQPSGPPHYVELHVNPGECVSLQLLDGQEQIVAGPATITMVSQQQNPPVPIPVQVPPGHMIHQIADENGTLKHIILSVMSTDDSAPLDSTVIHLPQGSFRVDSHGELVSTGTNEGGHLTTLPQQAYFANYDGCPIAYDTTALPDSNDHLTSNQQHIVLDSSYSNQQQQQQQLETDDKSKTDNDHQNVHCDKSTSKLSPSSDKQAIPAYAKDGPQTNITTTTNTNKTLEVSQTNLGISANSVPPQKDGSIIASDVIVSGEVDPTPMSNTPYSSHQMICDGQEMINTNLPLMSAADGQIYGYQPPCCCCCYCDTQEPSNTGQASMSVPGQQDLIISTESGSNVPLGPPLNRVSNRTANSGKNLNQPLNGAGVAYSGPIINSQGMQLSPTSSDQVQVSPSQAMQTMGITNGQHIQGSHLEAGKGSLEASHLGGKGGRGGLNNGYKQHKMGSGPNSNNQPSERQGYNSHYNSNHQQSYSSMLVGHQHYQHQPVDLTNSSTSYKSQTLLPNHQAPMMSGGNFPPIYSNYNQVPTNNVLSNSNKSNQQHVNTNYRNQDSSDGYVHRTREHVNFGGSGYVGGNAIRVPQHNDKRQALKDKSNNQQGRYINSNVKVMSNVTSNSPASSSSRTGSVSPTRAKFKGNFTQHQYNPINGSRHNQYGGSMQQPVGMYQSNFNHGPSTRAESVHQGGYGNAKIAKSNQDYNVHAVKHISSSPISVAGHHNNLPNRHKGAWQTSNNKLNLNKTNNDSSSESACVNRIGGEVADERVKAMENGGISADSSEYDSMLDKSADEANNKANKGVEAKGNRGKQKKCQNQSKQELFQPKQSTNCQHDQICIESDKISRLVSLKEANVSNIVSEETTSPAIDKTLSKQIDRLDSNSKLSAKNIKTKRNHQEKAQSSKLSDSSSSQNKDKTKNFFLKTTENSSKQNLELDDFQGDNEEDLNMDTTHKLSGVDSISKTKRKLSSNEQSDETPKDESLESQISRNKKRQSSQVAVTNDQLDNEHNESTAQTTPKKGQVTKSQASISKSFLKKSDEAKTESMITSSNLVQAEESESRPNDELNGRVSLFVQSAELPARSHSKSSVSLAMKTSFSDNNIQALEAAGDTVKSIQSAQQKALATLNMGNQQSKSASLEPNRKKNDKRRIAGNAKGEQTKLSTISQVKVLNLNCTSVTSSSVQLRWSYISNVAEKYGIHCNHGSKNANLMDHFVLEHSTNKSLETASLILPKIVYQGCASSHRINHLSPDKIHHFRVRRTALVTKVKIDTEVNSCVEHVAVSDVLSVTLPCIQQQPIQGNTLSGNKKTANGKHRNSIDQLDIGSNQGDSSSTSTTSTSMGGLNFRGNTSSHNISNISGNNKTVARPIKVSSMIKQCRVKLFSTFEKLIRSSLSSSSDTKFAGFLLVLFSMFGFLLAIFIHLYILAPVMD